MYIIHLSEHLRTDIVIIPSRQVISYETVRMSRILYLRG